MDNLHIDSRPRKRFRSSPQPVQYHNPRQGPGGILTDTLLPIVTSVIDQGTSLLLPSNTATQPDNAATRTRTRTRTRPQSQVVSDVVTSTLDSGSSSDGAVSNTGAPTAIASSLPGGIATDVQSSTAEANSMSAHQTHQQATESALPSSLPPTSTSAYTSVLITTTATVNGHLTTFATLVPTTLSSFPHDTDTPLKPPAVAAAIVGTLLATALLGGLGYLFLRRRRQRKTQSALNAARKQSMRRGRRVLDDDDDNDNEGDEDALPMRYATTAAGSSMSTSSYQYGVVGSLPHPPSPRRRTDTLSSFGNSMDALSFGPLSLSNNASTTDFVGRDPAEVRRIRAGRTGSSSGSIFREDFDDGSERRATRLVMTNARPESMASQTTSPSSAEYTPTSGNPFEGGGGYGGGGGGYYFPPHKRSSTASSSALGLLMATSGSLEVVNVSRSASPAGDIPEPSSSYSAYTQPPPPQQKRASVGSVRTSSIPSPQSGVPPTPSTASTSTSRASTGFQYPPSGRSPTPTQPSPTHPLTTARSPPPPPHAATRSTSTSPRSSSAQYTSATARTSLPPPPGAASPPGPLARTSILVDEQFGVSGVDRQHLRNMVSTPPNPPSQPQQQQYAAKRRSSSSVGSAFDPADLVKSAGRRDSFVLPEVGVSGTGSLRGKERGSRVDLSPYLSEEEGEGGSKGGAGRRSSAS